MLFNSTFFILIFFPIALLGWTFLKKLENQLYSRVFLTGMSFWFYGYYNINYLWILLASLVLNFIISFSFEKIRAKETGINNIASADGSQKKKPRPTETVLFLISLVGNLGLLFYFKYFNFFIDNVNFIFHSDITIEKIALPLGISFFTFQQISYMVDRYKEEAPHYRLFDYCCFISFFPQLVAGPIVLHEEFIPQLQNAKETHLTKDIFFKGLSLFTLGLSKKVLLADSLAVLVNAEYLNIFWLDSITAWCTIIFYMLELYFDFSGYCDMARGLGILFGFELPENFNSPLMAISVKDFWRRWHITLSRFFTKYVYIPLGGNRKGKARQCLNLFIVFFLSGLWHGANWTFVVWGIMNGLGLIFDNLFPKCHFKHDWARRIITGLYITLSFSVFRAESLADARLLWKKLFSFSNSHLFAGMCNSLVFAENYALMELLKIVKPTLLNPMFIATFFLLLIASILLISGKKAQDWIEEKGAKTLSCFILATLFIWSFFSLSQVSVFLYFNF